MDRAHDSIAPPSRVDTLARAVLIDLDGTMVDTAPDLCAAATLMLADLSHAPLTLATVASFIGNGMPMLVARVLAEADLDGTVDQGEAEARFAAHYRRTNGRHGSVYPGTLDGVAALHGAGYRLGCVTNKPLAFAEALLRATGLLRYFSAVVGGDMVVKMKPSAEPLLHACRLLGVSPRRALMVGDSAIDVAAARAAGMPAWLVRRGASNDGATAAGAQLIDSLDQLPARLAGA